MEWISALEGKVVGLDTAPLIYFIEENQTYLEMVSPFFEGMDEGKFTVINAGASFFLTNDDRLPELPGLTMLVMDEMKRELEQEE